MAELISEVATNPEVSWQSSNLWAYPRLSPFKHGSIWIRAETQGALGW